MTRRIALAAAAVASLAVGAAPAHAATVSTRVAVSDGVTLQTTLTGADPLGPRPTIVEFSPYGRNSGTFNGGSAYNHLLVQIRGTGDSDGRFDALGNRTQTDVSEILQWACTQPWSNGKLGINGFSASAITIYNSLHLPLPCVKAAVLKSGTLELYRDLLSPGGINNIIPGAGVLGLIGAPAAIQGLDRLQRSPASSLDIIAGLTNAGLSEITHPNLDSWWEERGFRGDVNHLPILMVNGFFDVESRGAFEGYRALKGDGAHLTVIGAHDGAPIGTDAGYSDMKNWFDHYLGGVANGVESQPKVKLWMSDGDREDMLNGKYTRVDGADWPIPGTRWQSLALDPARQGLGKTSPNDGSLGLAMPSASTVQSYLSVPSLFSNTDPPNTAILGGMGFNALTNALPVLSEMTLAQSLGLSYTTKALQTDVLSAGPASLELRLASTAPATNIWAVVSDVSPDGVAHPVASGRLNSAYPGVDAAKSLKDPVTNEIVEPYGDYSRQTPALPGQSRAYKVELWPIGNRFQKGHRIRLTIVGSSIASLPSVPALNTIVLGGPGGSRLLFPVLPGSNLGTALPTPVTGPTTLLGSLLGGLLH